MRTPPSAYLPERRQLAALLTAALGVTLPGPPEGAPGSASEGLAERIQVPATGPIDQRLQRLVEQIREHSGAQAVFIADAEGLELASTGADLAHIALLGEFAGVRRRIASTMTAKRPLAMSVALSETQWLQALWLDEDPLSPALTVVQPGLLSPGVASQLRALVQTILGNLR